jgi:hypothetical protein
LRFLHLELGLEPLDNFCDSRLLPASASEELARNHASALHRFISMCSPEEDQSDSTVLAEQPTVALMTWAKEAVLLVCTVIAGYIRKSDRFWHHSGKRKRGPGKSRSKLYTIKWNRYGIASDSSRRISTLLLKSTVGWIRKCCKL